MVIGLAKAQPYRRCWRRMSEGRPPSRICAIPAATRDVYHCEPRGTVIVEFDLAGRRLRIGKEYRQQ